MPTKRSKDAAPPARSSLTPRTPRERNKHIENKRNTSRNAATLSYLEAGTGGRTALLIHGNYAGKSWWRELLADPPEDSRLLAPDMPGFGHSPAGKGFRLSMSRYRTLATAINPAHGSLRLLGYDPADTGERRALRRRLGYLPQTLGYYPNFTVFEFVEYFALLKEMPHERVRPAVAEAIERVGLEDRAKSKLKTLSGGMIRRVGIAQAIVNDPGLLLLDEPTAGLDPEQRVGFRDLIRAIGQRGTVIVSTHLVEDVGAACSEVALMNGGRIVFRGTPDELSARGETGGAGDSPLERGYTSILSGARA